MTLLASPTLLHLPTPWQLTPPLTPHLDTSDTSYPKQHASPLPSPAVASPFFVPREPTRKEGGGTGMDVVNHKCHASTCTSRVAPLVPARLPRVSIIGSPRRLRAELRGQDPCHREARTLQIETHSCMTPDTDPSLAAVPISSHVFQGQRLGTCCAFFLPGSLFRISSFLLANRLMQTSLCSPLPLLFTPLASLSPGSSTSILFS